MTPLECNYTIAPFSDSVPTKCGRPAIKRATFPNYEMLYCYTHWQQVEDYWEIKEAEVEDLVEEQC